LSGIGDDPVERDPVERDPVEGDPVEGDPVEGDPVEGDPVEGDPVEGDPVVRFEGASKRFGDVTALDRVDLDLPARRTTAIIGESGSGKSTLLQLVNGLLVPDAGRVTVLGEDVARTDLVALRRRIGYAVQGSALFPHLTAGDNATLLARLVGWSEDRRRARLDHLLRLVDLDPGLADRHPHELSGGQGQRVSLVRALMLEPPLLLLDEPFSAVDPITRVGIHDHFLRLAEAEPASVVLVTHDLREAAALASFLVVLGEGRVVQAGETDAVIRAPATPALARLFEEHLS
jgi:osmoprotectant transport system ATP-binding protein